ncbi:MAG: glycosyltransferase [Anaerolineae bacterium]|nr:glycosyltransferase [Anaerolineae bacterium]
MSKVTTTTDTRTANHPRVSVGLAVYNGEHFIAEAIESILHQTYSDFELIICDNCSSDSTPAIIERYAAQDSRIRYYQNEKNIGWWRNFNRVFELSTGEYFMWATDDDKREPTFIERTIEVLDNNDWAILCYAQTKLIDSVGNEIPREAQRRGYYVDQAGNVLRMRDAERWDKHLDSPDPVERFRGIVLLTGFCHEQFALIRREVLAKTSLMAGYFGSDKAVLTQLCLLGRFASIPEPLFMNRRHPEQSSNIVSAKDRALWTDASQKVWSTVRLRLRVTEGAIDAVMKSNLTLAQRLACFWIIFRYFLDAGKWLTVFEEMTHRKRRKLLGQTMGKSV